MDAHLADFDDAEDFDDPEYASAPVAAPHPSVAPKPKSKKSKSYSDHDDEYDDAYAYDDAAYNMPVTGVSINDVALSKSRVVLRTNRFQWLGPTAGSPLRCDVPLSQITNVELKFAPTFADLAILFFFFGLTVALIELLPAGWLRGILAIIAGLFAAGMFLGVILGRVLRVHTAARVFDITVDDDIKHAEAFVASLQARMQDLQTGPFR